MSVSSIVKTAIDGTITLSDGTGTPVTLAATYSLGDLSITGLGKHLNEQVAITSRGKLRSVRNGARSFPSVSFSAYITSYTGVTSAPGSLMDFATGSGVYSSNASTLTGGDVYCCDLTFTVEGTDLGDSADATITVTNVALRFDVAESMDGNTVSFTGTVYGSVSDDIVAAQIS